MPSRRHGGRLVGDARAGADARHDPSVAYQLTIEPGTRFASMVAKREFDPLDSDAAAALYELTDDMTRPPDCLPMRSATMPGAARRAGTTLLTGATATMPGSARERTGAALECARFGIESPRISSRHCAATATASPRRRAFRQPKPRMRPWSWACALPKAWTWRPSPIASHVPDCRLARGWIAWFTQGI